MADVATSPTPLERRRAALKAKHLEGIAEQERDFARETVKTPPKLMGALQAQHLKAKNDLLKKHKAQLDKLHKDDGDSPAASGRKGA